MLFEAVIRMSIVNMISAWVTESDRVSPVVSAWDHNWSHATSGATFIHSFIYVCISVIERGVQSGRMCMNVINHMDRNDVLLRNMFCSLTNKSQMQLSIIDKGSSCVNHAAGCQLAVRVPITILLEQICSSSSSITDHSAGWPGASLAHAQLNPQRSNHLHGVIAPLSVLFSL